MFIERIHYFFRISKGFGIARRYFFTNGFDGALTMLGLNMGFYLTKHVDISVVLNASLGTAIALAMSGLTSAYISESAEKQNELAELERAMIHDLDNSEHGQAARLVPWIVALVNGLSPLLLALIIISPLWLTLMGLVLPVEPILATIAIAFVVLFLMGVFLGRLSKRNWLWTGVRAMLIAGITSLIIVLVDQAFVG